MSFHYTAHKNTDIDNVIQQHMDIITEEITKVMGNVDSIVLSGGFGRGEGSVRRLSNGGYLPINDYDLYIFSNTRISERIYHTVEERIHRGIRIEPQRANSATPDYFHVDIQFIRTDALKNLNPDMSTFGLKSASRVIWGADLRNGIMVEREDVPSPSVELNALFQSILGLIQNFQPEYLDYGVPEDRVARFNYECYKAYIAISTSLLLLHGVLELSHSRRAEILSRYYCDWFPELAKDVPDLSEKVMYYTDLKLTSLKFREENDPVQLWFRASDDLKTVLQYVTSKLLEKAFDSSADFCDFLYERRQAASFLYFEPYVRYMLKKKGIPTIPATIRAAMFGAILALNLTYMRDWHKNGGHILLRSFFSSIPPLMRIFLASALILNSLNEQGQIDSISLHKASEIIKVIFPYVCQEDDRKRTWMILREACLSSYKAMFRMQKIAF